MHVYEKRSVAFLNTIQVSHPWMQCLCHYVTGNCYHLHPWQESNPLGAVDFHPLGAVNFHPLGAVNFHPLCAVSFQPLSAVSFDLLGAVSFHPLRAVSFHPRGAVNFYPLGAVNFHPLGFVHSHVTLMVCFKANFLLRTIKYYLILFNLGEATATTRALLLSHITFTGADNVY